MKYLFNSQFLHGVTNVTFGGHNAANDNAMGIVIHHGEKVTTTLNIFGLPDEVAKSLATALKMHTSGALMEDDGGGAVLAAVAAE